jgi:ribosomal protein S18 acetylase RimI-like enzyme
MSSSPQAPRRATIEDLQAIVARLPEYWPPGLDMRPIHHAFCVHEFGDTALVIDDPADGSVAAYLLGFPTPAGHGYIHAVAVLGEYRGRGLGGTLYESFAAIVARGGARSLKAITRPENEASIAFHRALGFSHSEHAGYTTSGESRIVFRRTIGAGGELG